MQSNLAELTRRDIGLAAISVDGVAAARALTDRLGLAYPVVSDPTGAAIKSFGVFDAEPEIAWPATFVIARDGTVVYRWIADTYRVRIATAEVMKALPP